MAQRRYEKSIKVGEARPTPDLLRAIDSLFQRYAPENPYWTRDAEDGDGTITEAESVDELLEFADQATVSTFTIEVSTQRSSEGLRLRYSTYRNMLRPNRDVWFHSLSVSGTNEPKVLGVAAVIEKRLEREFNIPVAESDEFIRVEPSNPNPPSALPTRADPATVVPPRAMPPIAKPVPQAASPSMAPVETVPTPRAWVPPLLVRVLNSNWMTGIITGLIVIILLAIATAVATLT